MLLILSTLVKRDAQGVCAAALCELREKGLTLVAGIRSKQSNLKGLYKIVGGNSLSIV